MKFRIQTIVKSIQISFCVGIQIFGSLLQKIYVFLAIRCNKELTSQTVPNSKVPRIFSDFSLISTHRNFSEF
jgi:hypothetical protein